MIAYPKKSRYTAEDLVAIIAILRDPENGCPWDKVQTHESIRMNFLEEAYEAVDAIDLQDPDLLCEELGDVLMQVVFHARMEEEAGRGGWTQICDGVCRKLIWRHPHIFGPQDGAEGINDWDTLKNMEKGRTTMADDLASVPRALPALMRAAKLQKRAAKHGADIPVPQPDTLARLAQTVAQGGPDAEQAAGQLLFEAVALARASGVNPEQALSRYNDFFEQTTPNQTV